MKISKVQSTLRFVDCGSAGFRKIQNIQCPKPSQIIIHEDIEGAAHPDICRLMFFIVIKGAAHRNIIAK